LFWVWGLAERELICKLGCRLLGKVGTQRTVSWALEKEVSLVNDESISKSQPPQPPLHVPQPQSSPLHPPDIPTNKPPASSPHHQTPTCYPSYMAASDWASLMLLAEIEMCVWAWDVLEGLYHFVETALVRADRIGLPSPSTSVRRFWLPSAWSKEEQ
jgi:hypothetical protein